MLILLSLLSYLLSLTFYLLSYFILRWLLYTKNNQWRVQFLHTYSQGTSHIPHSSWLLEGGDCVTPSPFPNSAMLFGHDCQTTWQNMEMDTEQFRNLQESGICNIYVSSTKTKYCRRQGRNVKKGKIEGEAGENVGRRDMDI